MIRSFAGVTLLLLVFQLFYPIQIALAIESPVESTPSNEEISQEESDTSNNPEIVISPSTPQNDESTETVVEKQSDTTIPDEPVEPEDTAPNAEDMFYDEETEQANEDLSNTQEPDQQLLDTESPISTQSLQASPILVEDIGLAIINLSPAHENDDLSVTINNETADHYNYIWNKSNTPILDAHWSFDDSTLATSELDHIGELGSMEGTSPALTTGDGGVIGEAMTFNGTVEYLDAGAITGNYNLTTNTNPFTIEMWLKRDGTGAEHILSARETADNGESFDLSFTAGDAIEVHAYSDTTGDTTLTSTTTIADTNWHHIVLQYDATDFTLYLDGSADATITDATPVQTWTNTTDNLIIGADKD